VPAELLRDPSMAVAVLQAMTLGVVDTYLPSPRGIRDEGFHQAISDLLEEWAHEHGADEPAVRIVGEQRSARAHELRDLLARNSIPFAFHPADSDHGRVLLGESEGLSVLLLEREAIGGQAGSSSMIRNYLGLPRGVSGRGLATRAFAQVWSFGASIVVSRPVTGLRTVDGGYRISLEDGSEIQCRCVVVATGVSYRRLDAPGVAPLMAPGPGSARRSYSRRACPVSSPLVMCVTGRSNVSRRRSAKARSLQRRSVGTYWIPTTHDARVRAVTDAPSQLAILSP
jgi:glycine/D-amino acid oxidase-like deaminating enzyme